MLNLVERFLKEREEDRMDFGYAPGTTGAMEYSDWENDKKNREVAAYIKSKPKTDNGAYRQYDYEFTAQEFMTVGTLKEIFEEAFKQYDRDEQKTEKEKGEILINVGGIWTSEPIGPAYKQIDGYATLAFVSFNKKEIKYKDFMKMLSGFKDSDKLVFRATKPTHEMGLCQVDQVVVSRKDYRGLYGYNVDGFALRLWDINYNKKDFIDREQTMSDFGLKEWQKRTSYRR